MKKDVFLFICSPSLGTLDSWASVLHELKNKQPDAQFIFYAHDYYIIKQIELNSPLIKLASEIFTAIVYKDINGAFIKSNNFELILKYSFFSNHLNPFLILKKILNKLRIIKLDSCLNSIMTKINAIIVKIYNLKFINLYQLKSENLKILYDVYESSKDAHEDILTKLSEVKKYSICHGNNSHEYLLEELKTRTIVNNYPNNNTIVFASSEKDAEYYENYYGIKKEFCRVVGIPRHEKKWIDYFMDRYCSNYEIPFNGNYIFLISRNYGSFMPREEKVRYVKEIYKQAKKYNLKLIIKKHPDEVCDNSCEEALPKEECGIGWMVSNLHTFFLGKHSKFAICFYSGVVSDMISIGIPTIEMLDSKYAYNLNKNIKDKNSGKNVTEYGYYNLVLVANDNKELDSHIKRIFNEFEVVVSELKKSYDQVFYKKENVNEYIANEIIWN
ncbi:hypothetical protein [Campylobacter concisus]|uniref:hypothetical protein n=1 Tax=Campylobacter concisus TaxID=199 RepID=UPI00122CD6F4|nr:hypothetical protein [Campylobacter concisus]